MTSASPAEQLAHRLVAELGPSAHKAVDLALSQLSLEDRAALAYNWAGFWARPKQIIPVTDSSWRSYGFLTGRGFGKTRTIAEFLIGEMMAGRCMRLALCAETEDKTRDVMVEGESGLCSIAPPWFRLRYEPGNGRVIAPNGAVAFLYYATEPEKFRGPEHDTFWGDELGSWPSNTAAECWSNMHMGLRLRQGRLVWSSTPRSVALLHKLIARAKKRPEVHIIVRGSTLENRGNLPQHVVEEWIEEYGGTRIGRRELDGEDLDDNPAALFSQNIITQHRRRMPEAFVRRVVAVDPAISTRKGSDMTGIVVAGLGVDGQIYVLADLSGQYPPDRWARIVVDAFRRYECDLIVFEENRGGNLVLSNIRAANREIPSDRFKGVYARQGKELRAEPVATLYEKGRVSHVIGADLAELEKQMVEWDPVATPQSPDRIDAMVHAVLELARLGPKDKVFDDYAGGDRAPSRLDERVREVMVEEADDWDEDDAPAGRW
jgi:phage terminase large subunit-like protein